jgi:hypothetical protein
LFCIIAFGIISSGVILSVFDMNHRYDRAWDCFCFIHFQKYKNLISVINYFRENANVYFVYKRIFPTKLA